jgi:hypothetical protein
MNWIYRCHLNGLFRTETMTCSSGQPRRRKQRRKCGDPPPPLRRDPLRSRCTPAEAPSDPSDAPSLPPRMSPSSILLWRPAPLHRLARSSSLLVQAVLYPAGRHGLPPSRSSGAAPLPLLHEGIGGSGQAAATNFHKFLSHALVWGGDRARKSRAKVLVRKKISLYVCLGKFRFTPLVSFHVFF